MTAVQAETTNAKWRAWSERTAAGLSAAESSEAIADADEREHKAAMAAAERYFQRREEASRHEFNLRFEELLESGTIGVQKIDGKLVLCRIG